MTQTSACRNRIANLWRAGKVLERNCAHAGLVLAKCLKDHDSKQNEAALLDVAIQSVERAAPLYRAAYERWKGSVQDCPELPSHLGVFFVQGRMVIGLGGASVLETGLTLHHTYGTPVIPGSALKGLAAHYCHQVWGEENLKFRGEETMTDAEGKKRKRPPGEYHLAIFGSQQDAGHITFHDAWVTPSTLRKSLLSDVMTPHHQKYYGEPQGSKEHPPTDFDDPIPVAFLSMTGGFLVALSCDVAGEVGQQWVDLAFQLLSRALEEWGIGGKTNTGYGRMLARSALPARAGEDGVGAGTQLPEPEPARPIHAAGEKVEVVRVEDKKGKRCFETVDDRFRGVVAYGEPPEIQVGAKTTLWIAAAMKDGYNFRSTDPGASKRQGTKKPPREKGKGRR